MRRLDRDVPTALGLHPCAMQNLNQRASEGYIFDDERSFREVEASRHGLLSCDIDSEGCPEISLLEQACEKVLGTDFIGPSANGRTSCFEYHSASGRRVVTEGFGFLHGLLAE